MISNHNHSPNPYTDLIEHTLILGAAPCLSWHPSFRASEQRSNDFSAYQINHGQKMSKNVKHQLVAVTMSRHRYILCHLQEIRRPTGVSCGSCLFVVLLSVLSLSRLSPWRGFLPRLT